MAASPAGTIIYPGSGAITDSVGRVWSIDSNGKVVQNGQIDHRTDSVLQMAYDSNGVVWQENANDLWWKYDPPNQDWRPFVGTSTVPIPFTPSPNGTKGSNIVDNSGNKWSIVGGQVAVDGNVDPATANVTNLAFVNGKVWQENASGLWWSKTTPAGTWSPDPGTRIDPVSGSSTSPAAGNNTPPSPPTQTTVTLYREPFNGEPSITFDKPGVYDLSKIAMESWNDQVSSVKTTSNLGHPASASFATFYGNINYNNTAVAPTLAPTSTQRPDQNWISTLQPGDYPLASQWAMKDDTLSSVYLGPSTTVELFRDPFFLGHHITLATSDPDLRKDMMTSWDNQASSIKVSGGDATVYDSPNPKSVLGKYPGTTYTFHSGDQVNDLNTWPTLNWSNRISSVSIP